MPNIEQDSIQLIASENELPANRRKGPISLRMLLDFTSVTQYDLDLQHIQSRTIFDSVQTIFVDNQTGVNVVITIGVSGQVIVAKSNTQGYYPVIVPNPAAMKFVSTAGGVVRVYLMNVSVAGAVWATA